MGMFDWLFGKSQGKQVSGKAVQGKAAKTESSDPWDRAITLAESGRRAEAVAEFRRAIARNPNFYIREIKPGSAKATACWKEAVDQYVREKEARTGASRVTGTRCAQCDKDIGIHWHYDFESISYGRTVASQCPDCGRILCSNDVTFGPDRNYAPCPHCGVSPVSLFEGPAASSCVEQGQSQRRYVGAIRPPSALGRDIKTG